MTASVGLLLGAARGAGGTAAPADAGPRCVRVPMPDGAMLTTDLWNAAGRRPVVLERTPYGRARTDQSERTAIADRPIGRAAIAARFDAAGFAYAVQDCRGTGGSEGCFAKYTQEAGDTAALLQLAD